MSWLGSQVKFPERALLFKVESGSSAERDNWVAALEAAKQAKSRSTQQALGAEKLEQLQKVSAMLAFIGYFITASSPWGSKPVNCDCQGRLALRLLRLF